ncbi:MAG TPA: class I SAM-dependent methyltransferase [Vicinamibacterales bacterium]|nr:class I SAM-dependent methyltransferase [Vicinamibacterales bacterium]
MDIAGRTTAFIEQAYWIVLNRPPTALELADQRRHHLNSDQVTLSRGLLHSQEFRRLRAAWQDARETHADPPALERALQALGSDAFFVERVYESLLARTPDEGGAVHYLGVLGRGERRTSVARALALSDEFARRWMAVPCDTQLCELANPAKWDNPEWLDLLRSLGLSDDRFSMHRKPYELTQFIYGCSKLGALTADADVISIGAGHEIVLYWLANRVKRVVATDLYEGYWTERRGREGDPSVLDRPDEFAPFPYRQDRLTFLKMDGRSLDFPDDSFDIAYSLSSIEHFGGLDGAAQTIREMTRILKPGGILAVATEYALAGPPGEDVFQPHEIHQLIAQPGLELVEPLDEQVYRRYQTVPVDVVHDPYRTPHMVVHVFDTVFTSVMLFLRKLPPASPA